MNSMMDQTRLGFAMRVLVIALALATNASAQAPTAPTKVGPYSVTPPAHAPGQTATLLPDGRWLLVGGNVGGLVSDAIFVFDSTEPLPSPIALQSARVGHTTTVLPDGSLLVFGGTDGDGNLLASGEIIDLSTNTVRSATANGLIPRSSHTATLLTDGRVLLAGGIDASGVPIAAAQLWNPKTSTVDPWNPLLQTPRYEHNAALLGNGEGLISGGRANQRPSALPPELFNPSTNIFEPAASQNDPRIEASAVASGAIPTVADTLPAAEAIDVPIDTQIAFRFSQALRVTDLNTSTVTLVGPAGVVPVKVVGAEGGMLAFVTPTVDLSPGTTYTAFLQGTSDVSGQPVPLSSVRFTTHRFETPATQATATPSALTPSPSTTAAKPVAAPSASIAKTTSGAKVASTTVTESPKIGGAPDEGVEDWLPHDQNRHGQWRVLGLAGDPALAVTALSTTDLSAPAGQTGVAGHIVRVNGNPLAGVAVSIGKMTAMTDATGRFLLVNVPIGPQQLLVDGTALTRGGWHYTKHYIRVEVSAAHTTVLPQSVYLSRIDPATEVSISSPAAQEIVLTHPAIPGLEVHIPRGTVLREYGGQVVTKVSITPVPVDRAPYPTPQNFSAYFTLQPGGAFVDGDATKAIKVVYPNYLGLAPGAQVNFYNYDPSNGGWGVYGHGTVTKDGKQVAPDTGVGFRQIMGFGLGIGNVAPPAGPPAGGCVSAADPVDCATGFFMHTETDMVIKDSIPISVTRTYQSNDPNVHAFGVGTNYFYAMHLYTPDSDSDVYLVLSDGSQIRYQLQSTSPYVWKALNSPTAFYGSIMQYAPGQNGQINLTQDLITITLADHSVLTFASDATSNQLLSIADRNGNTVRITLSGGRSGNITQVTSPNGRSIQFLYDSCNRVTQAQDNIGRTVVYSYYPSTTACMGGLYQVTDQNNQVETYYYDSSNRLQKLVDKRQNQVFYNMYDSNNRVAQQTLADNALWQFGYTVANGNNVTTVTDPRNYIRQDTFNTSGYLTQEILAMGQPEQQTYVLQRGTSNLLADVTDALGRMTVYNSYDAYGNPLSVTQLAGTANAVTSSFTYDPIYHQLATYTDPLYHGTSLYYDASGNLNQITNAINNSWTLLNNAAGLPTMVTDPLGHTVQLSYQGADLATVKDGLGRTSTIFTDDVGRVVTAADPLNETVQYAYDARDQLLHITDPMNGITSIAYDPNGNVQTVTDPRKVGNHGYTYDSRNRPNTYTDPAGAIETYHFDGMSNLDWKIDRNGQKTQYVYDGINRLKTVTYADGTTIGVTWDGGNRPHIITDSANGVITQNYDGLDNLLSEQSPQGQVSNLYDAASRRYQMTVNSNIPVVYGYDNANRLTSITQGTVVVGLAPDAANRPDTITYPNGILATYGIDAANQLQSLIYTSGAMTIGNLAYTYDSAGRQITKSGSLATLVMPSALTTQAPPAYTWNARNQLTGTNAGGAAFAYDAFGRRVSATVSGVTTPYLYDGLNPAMISNTQILAGPHLDEAYAQVAAGATTSRLSDGLNSTIALTNSSGATTGSYAYSPYGETTSAGTATTPLQFTGRENDGPTGLYYNRARYYSPQLGRFISQDPIGLAGGINTYAYTNGNPVSYIDPLGLYCLSEAQINAIAGSAGGAVAGGASFAAFGPLGIAVGSFAGGIAGGVIGYYSSNTLGNQIGLGTAGGAIGYQNSPGGNLVGGAVGGVVAYGLHKAGAPDAVSLPSGGAVGGAVAGAIVEGTVAGAVEGGAIGAAAGAVTAAVAAGVQAGNDCGCGKK
jgi:RHS repeat-associated protein